MGHPHPRLKREFDRIFPYIFGKEAVEISGILSELGYSKIEPGSHPNMSMILSMEIKANDNHSYVILLDSRGTGVIQRVNLNNAFLKLIGGIIKFVLIVTSVGGAGPEDNTIRFQYLKEIST